MRTRTWSLFTLVAVLGTWTATARAADTYSVDASHSDVTFKIRHLISQVSGRFNDFSGTVKLDPSDPTRSSVTFAVKTTSIDTREPKRDDHLRGPDFFDATKWPDMTFVSRKIVKGSGKNVYAVSGDFTMRGVTQPMTIPVEFLGTVKDPWGNEKAAFSATFTFNRKDFGMVWNKALDAGGVLLGDDVTATVNLEMVKAKAEK